MQATDEAYFAHAMLHCNIILDAIAQFQGSDGTKIVASHQVAPREAHPNR